MSVDDTIAQARGFNSVTEMRDYFERNGYPGAKGKGASNTPAVETRYTAEEIKAQDLAIANAVKSLTASDSPSARSQALTEELRTARTKAERDRAVDRFMAAQPNPEEARFSAWLRNPGHEYRAMTENTGSNGGYIVPTGFFRELMHLTREYSGIMAGWGEFSTPLGSAIVQPSYSAFTSGTITAEGSPVADGPYSVIGQRSWPEAPIYSGSVTASLQLVQDYGADASYATFVKRGLAEALGRKLAADAATCVYTSIGTSSTTVNLTAAKALNLDTGATTELTANGLTITTYAAMWKALDAAYKPTAEWRMNSSQAEKLSRIVDSQGRYQIDPQTGTALLFNRPIRITNSVSDLTASTASGPILLSPEFAFTQRVVTGDATFLASNETRAEFLELYYRAILRSSFMAADPNACVGVKPAAT